LAASAAHNTPFQKGEAPMEEREKKIGIIDPILMVNCLLPKFIVIKVISLKQGSKQIHIHFSQTWNS
jgi:hypothetical protein